MARSGQHRALRIVGLGLVTVVVAACTTIGTLPSTQAPAQSSKNVAPSSTPTEPPNPGTHSEAIDLVRMSPDFSRLVSPFKLAVDWTAEWRGDRWFVAGLFLSQWDVRFIEDATIYAGTVQTDYFSRPEPAWVQAAAERWGLTRLYSRLTDSAAISLASNTGAVASALEGSHVLDAAARVVRDDSQGVDWVFAFYVQRSDEARSILTVTGLGSSGGASEGDYVDGYGFGSATETSWTVPLWLADWVSGVASDRAWAASNLP